MSEPRESGLVSRTHLGAVLIVAMLCSACHGSGQPARPPASPTPAALCRPACMPSTLLSAGDLKTLGEPLLILISLHGYEGLDAEFVLGRTSIELRDLQGRSIWATPVIADRPPHLVAVGDFDGDGVTDGIFQILTTPTKPIACGASVARTTSLIFVSGATGAVSSPIGSLQDICWSGFGVTAPYATHQWALGTAYIGPMTSGDVNDVVAFPYYATSGTVLRDSSSAWSTVGVGDVMQLTYPSTPEFDRVYDAANPKPCSVPIAGGPCYRPSSHVANGVFLDSNGRGLFVLTSTRAVVYGPDMLPHSDLTWVSGGRTDNQGRNYGLLQRVPGRPGEFVLIGGCDVIVTQYSMLAGKPFGGLCGLHRHYEWFAVKDGIIVAHASRYYSFTATDGEWEGRIEYPMHASSSFAGAPGTIVFNLYRNGQWRVVVMTDPSRPDTTREYPGWYAWDLVDLPGGAVRMLATRAPAGGGDASKLLPWEFDVLQWDGVGLVSLQHTDGFIPALIAHAPTAALHTSDDVPYATFTTPESGGYGLLVEDRSGNRSEVLIG